MGVCKQVATQRPYESINGGRVEREPSKWIEIRFIVLSFMRWADDAVIWATLKCHGCEYSEGTLFFYRHFLHVICVHRTEYLRFSVVQLRFTETKRVEQHCRSRIHYRIILWKSGDWMRTHNWQADSLFRSSKNGRLIRCRFEMDSKPLEV